MSRVSKFFVSFIVFVAVCGLGLYWFVNHEVERAFNQAVADVPGLRLTYADISVDIFERCVVLRQVDTTLPGGQHLSADTVRITAFDQKNPVPHFIAAQARGLVVDVTPANVGDWAGPLSSLGFDRIAGDAALDYRYDPDSGTLTIRNLSIKAPELGDVHLSGVLDRLDLAQLRMERLVGLRMARTDLVFTDRALVNAMVRSMARLLNTSEGDARGRLRAEMEGMADYARKSGNGVAAKALSGLGDFVAAPGTMTISARPGEPVPVLYLFMGRDVYDNMELLKVTVTTDAEHRI
jgi:hypothetical protein